MDPILKLQARAAELVKDSRAVLDAAQKEDRSMNDEERAKVEANRGKLDDVKVQIRDLEAQEQLEASMAQSKRQSATALLDPETESRGAKPHVDDTDFAEAGFTRRAGKRVSVRDRSDHSIDLRFGQFLQDVHAAMTGRGVSARLERIQTECRAERAAQGMGVSIGADGGFMVQTDVSRELFRRMNDVGDLLSRVKKLPPLSEGSDSVDVPAIDETSRATGSRWGGITGYWVAEGTAPTASKPKIKQITLKPSGVACLGYATDKLLKHAAVLGFVMLEGFAEELSFLSENAIIRGNGAGQPHGIINSSATVSVAKEAGQVAATFTFANAVKMWSRLYARSRRDAIWAINQDVEPQLFSMSMAVGTGGVPVYMPAGGLSQAPFATLFGRPVVPLEYMSTLGTTGDVVLFDPTSYWVVDLGAPESASSMHVAFTTFEQAFRCIYYIDGQTPWQTALTPFQGSNTVSPFVKLDTRA